MILFFFCLIDFHYLYPRSMVYLFAVSWIRIHLGPWIKIPNADPDPEEDNKFEWQKLMFFIVTKNYIFRAISSDELIPKV